MKKIVVSSLLAGSVLFGATVSPTYIQELVQYLASKPFEVNGKFYSYDFEKDGNIDPNDWIYVSTLNNSAYRLLAVEPTDTNAFGFAPVELPSDLPSEPNGYFIQINFPMDVDPKFSWVYVTGNSVFKLMGATPNNTFDYLDVNGDGTPDPLPHISVNLNDSSSLPGEASVPMVTFILDMAADTIQQGQGYAQGYGQQGQGYGQQGGQNTNLSNPTSVQSLITTTTAKALTPEQVYEVAYMWNEEKLAHDVYLNLYNLFSNEPMSRPLYNIATRSETQHMEATELLLKKYDIDATNVDGNFEGPYDPEKLRALGSGEFSLQEIQSLYDQLYAKGSQSLKDALEVGCIVEVTDVEDLNKALEIAGDNQDLVNVFTFLREGSYNHYWAFDRALKNIGVTQGCCSLGEEYCKTPEEFPESNNAIREEGHTGGGHGYHGGRW